MNSFQSLCYGTMRILAALFGYTVSQVHMCAVFSPAGNDPKKKREESPVYEQGENVDNPLRCPVKLYEFYLSKW